MHDGDQDRIIAELGRLGEFFTLTSEPREESVPTLARLSDDRQVLAGYIAWYAGRLQTAEARVAGSILFQGLAARLWSPVVASVLLYGVIPMFDPETTRWHPDSDSGRLAPTRLAFQPGGASESVVAVVDGLLLPLVRAIRRRARISEALLWGNAASAAVGSLRVLASVRPETLDAGREFAEKALEYGPLVGTGKFVDASFVRASCCLFYRVADGGLCGDCVLRKP